MKHLITLLSLIAAVVAYIIGTATGAIIFLGLGVIFEAVFWARLFRYQKH